MSTDETAVITADATGVIREWNPAATVLFGHRAREVVGASLDVVVPPAYREAHWHRFRAVMSGEAPRLDGACAHLPVRCADGEDRVVPARFTLVRDPFGAVVGAVATYLPGRGDEQAFTPIESDTAVDRPDVRRVVANLHAVDTAVEGEFWRGLFGLEVGMDVGWIVNLRVPDRPSAQVQLVTRDATAPQDSQVSVEVGDVDAVHAEAVRRGLEVVHPLTDEPWGVRRFFLRSPEGVVVNVLAHRP